MVPRYLDVFTIGPVSKMLRKNAGPVKYELRSFIEDVHPTENFSDWEGFIDSLWAQTLSRLLLKIQSYQHGGAILISGNQTDLNVKYKINYSRLTQAVINYAKESINSYIYEGRIEERLQSGKNTLSKNAYLEETRSLFAKTEVANEIKGCVCFIASQTCVDGVVLFSMDMVAKGFGAVIKSKKMPRKIFVSSTATATPKSLLAADPNHFGTRHRSMISYCWSHPGSLGLVISQDGDIRAFSKIEDKLIMWENIKTQQYLKSRKLRRTPMNQVQKTENQ